MRPLGIFLIVFPFLLSAQDFKTQLQQAIDHTNKGEHQKALEIGMALFDQQPNTPEAYNIIAFNQICLGNLNEAAPYLARS